MRKDRDLNRTQCCDSKFICLFLTLSTKSVFLNYSSNSRASVGQQETMTAVAMPQQPRSGVPVLVHVEFEVFGGVQGVQFAKYCKEMCDRFDLKGWTKPSAYGTIVGVIQGEKPNVDEMAMWLQHQGSPGSRIDHCELRNWQIVDRCDYRRFNVRY